MAVRLSAARQLKCYLWVDISVRVPSLKANCLFSSQVQTYNTRHPTSRCLFSIRRRQAQLCHSSSQAVNTSTVSDGTRLMTQAAWSFASIWHTQLVSPSIRFSLWRNTQIHTLPRNALSLSLWFHFLHYFYFFFFFFVLVYEIFIYWNDSHHLYFCNVFWKLGFSSNTCCFTILHCTSSLCFFFYAEISQLPSNQTMIICGQQPQFRLLLVMTTDSLCP